MLIYSTYSKSCNEAVAVLTARFPPKVFVLIVFDREIPNGCLRVVANLQFCIFHYNYTSNQWLKEACT